MTFGSTRDFGLYNIRDLGTAMAFLDKIENFKTYASHHGTTAQRNPSSGNNNGGLYNIALKSIGAAASLDNTPKLFACEVNEFQLTRGLLGLWM